MKIRKRISAILLTLALVLTMMPSMAFTAFADDAAAFGIAINGKTVNVTVTKQELADNAVGPQIFPFAAKKGQTWQYAVAEGASFEGVLTDALGIDSLDRIGSAKFNWLNENGEEAGQFDLAASDLPTMVKVFKLIDQNGDDITGAFDATVSDITSAEAVAIDGAADVTPVIAYKYKMYNSYAEAVAARDDGTWETGAKEEVRPFVGGNLDKETFLKKDGSVKMGMLNFVGKFSIVATNSDYKLNVKDYEINLPAEPEKASLTMTVGDSAKEVASSVYTDVELDYLDAVWESDNTGVATVDNGSITPVKEGTATVSLLVYEDGTDQLLGTIGEWAVTVKAKTTPTTPTVTPTTPTTPTTPAIVKKPAKPGKPTSFKVKNIKKRTAKLTWKKAKNAKGYEIWRSAKNKKNFKKIKTVKKLSYKNTKLKKGRTYYYKVRAYRIVDGKKVYGKFTAIKKIKIKK